MLASVSTPREIAKKQRARTYPSKGTKVRHILPFELFLRELWPQDRTKNYMRLTGAKQSTAKLRIRGKRLPDYSEIAAILRSEHGFQFLQHIMDGARPAWFAKVTRAKEIGGMRRNLADQQRRIAQLEMAIE